jgi:hypothetical protein
MADALVERDDDERDGEQQAGKHEQQGWSTSSTSVFDELFTRPQPFSSTSKSYFTLGLRRG